MVILHIAAIENNPFNGVCVAVPQHVLAQSEYATAGLINVKNERINLLNRSDVTVAQIDYIKPFDIRCLPKPYNSPNIVIFHECYRLDYLTIAKSLRKNKIPYIVCPHGELREEAQQKKHLKKVIANILLFNDFINHAIAIQCLSQAEVEATHFGRERFIGTNGISLPSSHKEMFSSNGIRFIYIGRYEWYVKGLDLLFDAIKEVKDFLRKNNCHFDLYGPDIHSRFEAVTNLVKDRDIEDIVSLHHEISGEVKKAVLLSADIFVQTSRHEGMPMGILEAMGYGLPCLVTEGTTLGEEIEKARAGWNAKNEAADIAKKIVDCVTQKDNMHQIGNNGIDYVEKHYSWSIVSEEAVSKYANLLAKL